VSNGNSFDFQTSFGRSPLLYTVMCRADMLSSCRLLKSPTYGYDRYTDCPAAVMTSSSMLQVRVSWLLFRQVLASLILLGDQSRHQNLILSVPSHQLSLVLSKSTGAVIVHSMVPALCNGISEPHSQLPLHASYTVTVPDSKLFHSAHPHPHLDVLD
jgi:hypothetical protein